MFQLNETEIYIYIHLLMFQTPLALLITTQFFQNGAEAAGVEFQF